MWGSFTPWLELQPKLLHDLILFSFLKVFSGFVCDFQFLLRIGKIQGQILAQHEISSEFAFCSSWNDELLCLDRPEKITENRSFDEPGRRSWWFCMGNSNCFHLIPRPPSQWERAKWPLPTNQNSFNFVISCVVKHGIMVPRCTTHVQIYWTHQILLS